jgi:hypothetical protein
VKIFEKKWRLIAFSNPANFPSHRRLKIVFHAAMPEEALLFRKSSVAHFINTQPFDWVLNMTE